MLTAVIRADGSPQALAATLSVLVPAVAEGFLGHAVIVDPAGNLEIERIADATGARYLSGGGEAWQRGAGEARGDWIVLLDAGDVPQTHWVETAERHLLLASGQPALIPLEGGVASLRERAAVAFAGRQLRPGLILPKAVAQAGRLGRRPKRLPVRRARAG